MRAAVEAGMLGPGLCAMQRNVEIIPTAAKRVDADIFIKLPSLSSEINEYGRLPLAVLQSYRSDTRTKE